MSNRASAQLARLGFDIPRWNFALRTALASGLALMLAWLIGLEHPQWSAMTVWAVSQPVRGMLVEKSLFRAAGTVVGTAFGIGLVLVAGDNLPLLVISLSLWVGLCVGVGNLLHGLISYGALLSGYSASMVALLNTQQPAGQILALGSDRLLTVMTGVLVGLLVGLLCTPRRAEDPLSGRVRRTTAQLLHDMAARFTGLDQRARAEVAHTLLQEIASAEEDFASSQAGSPRNHRRVRALRALVQAQVSGVYWLRNSRNLPTNTGLAEALEQAAQALELNGWGEECLQSLEAALARCADDGVTAAVLGQLRDALRDNAALEGAGNGPMPLRSKVVLHRDWIGARQAMFRATGLLLVVGGVWVATGWGVGAYLMLGVSVMIALFSTFETPAHIMGHIFIWQAVAAVAALACHWLIWPHLTAEWQLVATLIPFIVLITPFYAHPRWMTGSIDYVMALLLLSRPLYPLSDSFTTSASTAAAVVCGPLLAYLAFKTIWPTDARRRRLHLTDLMLRELATQVSRPTASERQAIRQARLYHRILKLIQHTSRTGDPLRPVTDGALAAMAVSNAIPLLHELRHAPDDDLARQSATSTLRRLQRLRQDPEAAAAALRQLASHLWGTSHPAAWEMENAARSLQTQAAFFR